MATSDVSIINSALIKIGEATITSTGQSNKAARIAKVQYPIKRDELLRMYRWNFAMARAILAPESTAPEFGFSYKFLVPTDCVEVVGLFDDNEPQQNYTSSRTPFKVEGKYILADDDTLYVFYRKSVTDPTQFDAQFVEVLAWSLALDLAYDLTLDETTVARCDKGLEKAIKAAKVSNAIEGTPEMIQASEWLDSRFDTDPSNLRLGPVFF